MLTWIWLAAGILLTASELLLPGLVVVFLGIAALLVSGLCWTGLIDTVILSLATWMGTSVLLVLLLRKAVIQWFPPEVRRDIGDEDLDAFGQSVTVVEDCQENDTRGRIRFQGTTWPASSTKGTITAGQQARLLYRDNLAWIIEPLEELAENGGTPPTPDQQVEQSTGDRLVRRKDNE